MRGDVASFLNPASIKKFRFGSLFLCKGLFHLIGMIKKACRMEMAFFKSIDNVTIYVIKDDKVPTQNSIFDDVKASTINSAPNLNF